jgi:C-terminal processing protease CtpA/Prc
MFIDSAMAWPLGVEAGGVHFAPWPDIQPVSGAPPYTNRVAVLINGASLSSGELFPEVMSQLPNITIVGDTTAGAGCNTRQVSPGDLLLPSGKLIHIPTGCLLRYDGIPWETIGIAPDITVEQPEADFARGVDTQLEFAIAMLR